MSEKPEAAKEAAKAEAGKDGGGHHGAGGASASGGIKGWLPLIIACVMMPVMAVVTTQFVIVPKVLKAREAGAAADGEEGADAAEEHGGKEGGAPKEEKAEKPAGGEQKGKKEEPKPHEAKEAKEHGGSKDAHAKGGKGKKQMFQISKLIVNVSGTAGTRYLMTSATLVGSKADFKDVLDENKDQLLDLTIGTLSTKTIADLEKPGSRNQIRSELISVYNNALGVNLVQEIYFTEFAIQ